MYNGDDNKVQKVIIGILGTIIIIFAFLFVKPHLFDPKLPPGMLAPNPPVQTKENLAMPITRDKYTYIPLANFSITGKILAKKRYFWGKESKISPVDFAMGWGAMSDRRVVKAIKISQHGRWYYWKTKTFPIPRREIEMSSANMHIIPASKIIRKKVLQADEGDIVKFTGYLVRVVAPNWSWQSSLSRKDTGNHACEVVYVKTFEVLY
ncbi:MAG: hypothetical protein ACLFQM_02205 [Fidelibacterota bacterium]